MPKYKVFLTATADLISLGPDSDKLRHRFDGELEPCGVLRRKIIIPLILSEDPDQVLEELEKYARKIKAETAHLSSRLIKPNVTLDSVVEVLEDSQESTTENCTRIYQTLLRIEEGKTDYQI